MSAPTGGFTIAQIEAGQVRFVQDGSDTAPSFSIWVSDGSNASLAITPTVHFTDPPIVIQGPTTGSVADGGTFSATGHLTALDGGDAVTWDIVGGSHVTGENYNYAIHEFQVTKVLDGTSTPIFDDTFNGTVPPNGPHLPGAPTGALPYFDSGGSYVQGGNEALLQGSNAAYLGYSLGAATYGDPVVGQFATLQTGTSFNNSNPQAGLRSGQSFAVNGLFDLTTPSDPNTHFGIRLTDRITASGANNQPGTESVDLGVVRNPDGTASVVLYELNFETGVRTTLASSAEINTQSGDNEILLSLSNDAANNGQVVASYTLEHNVNGMEVADGSPIPLNGVGHIFDNENWTLPEFYGVSVAAPTTLPQTDLVMQGTYGQLDLTQNGTWHYVLNPGLASVEALAPGQVVHDNFQVTATDISGAKGTQTISIAVTGDEPPVAAAPTAHYSALPNTGLDLRGTGLSISDPDAGTDLETVTLSVGEGIINVTPGHSGVSHVSGNGTGSVTFSGTVAQINALLNNTDDNSAVTYNDAAVSGGSTTLTLTVHDGNSDRSASASSTIDLGTQFLDWRQGIDPFGATEGSSTQWSIPNIDGQTSTVFTGTGFTYDPVSGLPTGGTIASMSLVDNLDHTILQTITGLTTTLAALGSFIAQAETIRNEIPWAGLIEHGDKSGPLSFTETDIKVADTDGTFTHFIGSGFAQAADGAQLDGTVTSIEQTDARGNVLHTVDFGPGISLSNAIAALSPEESGQQFYDLANAGDTQLTGYQTEVGTSQLFYENLDDSPGNHSYSAPDSGSPFFSVNFRDATSSVHVDLGAGTANWGDGNSDTLSNISGVLGSKFADTIVGGNNGGYLDGGGAPSGLHDTLTAGGAYTTFGFQQGYGATTITNFDQATETGVFGAGQNDQIDLRNFTSPFTVTYVPDGGGSDTVLNFGGGDVLTLQHVTQSEFDGTPWLGVH